MITAPALFEQKIGQGSTIDASIIELTDGVDKFYYSDVEMKLTDGHVHNIILKKPTWEQTMNDVDKTWSRVVVELTLTNIWYKKDTSGNKVQLSQLAKSFTGRTAKLYLLNNAQSKSLSDCLEQFDGVFSRVLSYTETEVRLELLDSAGFLFKRLATESIKDVTGSMPNPKSRLLKIPLVYGEFQREPIPMGLSKAPLLNIEENRFVIDSKQIFQTAKLYIVNGENLPPFLVDPNFVNMFNSLTYPNAQWLKDDGGALLTSEQFYLNPNDSSRIAPLDDTEKYGDVLNNYLAVDTDVDTKSKFVMDETTFQRIQALPQLGDAGKRNQIVSLLGYEIYESGRLKDMFLFSEIAPKLFFNYINLTENTAIDFFEEFDFGAGLQDSKPKLSFILKLLYSETPDLTADISNQDSINAFSFLFVNTDFQPIESTSWQQVGFVDRSGLQDSNRDFGIITQATITGLNYETFDDIPDTWLFEVGDMFLTLVAEFSAQSDPELFSGINAPYGFVACKGRKFESWIDNVAWSNNFDEGEMIQNPSMIIASLLIDEADKSVSDLDVTTFEDALSKPIVQRINIIDEETTIMDVINQLSMQSLGSFVWTASNKGRFIPLRETGRVTPTVDLTIRYDEILNGFISVTETDAERIVNHLTIKSRWLEEESRFVDEDIYTNQTSIDKYGGTGVGERKQILEFKQINSYDNSSTIMNPVDWLAVHLIDADEVKHAGGTHFDDGYLSVQRGIIRLTLVNNIGSKSEIGDVIAIDPNTTDQHLLYNNESWSGKYFNILRIKQSGEITFIEAKQKPVVNNMVNGLRQTSDLL